MIVGTQEWALPDRRLSQYLADSIPARARCLGGIRSPRGAPLTPRSAAMPSSHRDQLVPTPQRRTRAAATASRVMACTPPSRATLTTPPARLAARPMPSQGRAGAPVRASRCQDRDDPKPAGLRSRSTLTRSECLPRPRIDQKRYINRWADRSVVGPGPGSPTAETMLSKGIKCGFESHPGHNSKAH